MVQHDPAYAIQAELGRDERLLWSGRPRQGIVLRPLDALFIPFSLLWGGFALFWEGAAIISGAPFFFSLWGIPFVLVGLYMIFGRFIVDARQRANTLYGVTDERIIILSGLLSRNVKSLNLRTLTDVSMDQRANGSGTITFGPASPLGSWGATGMSGFSRVPMPPSFEMIPDVRRVYEIIRDAQRTTPREDRW
jgi:hypothetical protein